MEVTMKREDLIAIGLTDEQIERVMAENGKDVQSANAKANKNNDELTRLKEIEKEYNSLKDQNLTEVEKANKALEVANNRIAELEKAQMIVTKRSNAATKFKITTEQATLVIKDDGSLDFDTLGKIILEKETAAAQAKEQEIAKSQDIPGGGNVGNGNKEKTADVENAEQITFGNPAPNAEAKDHYLI